LKICNLLTQLTFTFSKSLFSLDKTKKLSHFKYMKINPKLKTFFRIGNESQALKPGQTTEAIFTPDGKYEKLIRDLRAKIVGASGWLKEEIKSNVDGAKLLVTNPKEAFGGFGKNVAQLVEIAERKLALAQNKSLQPKIEPNIPAVVPENVPFIPPIITPKVPLVQKYPNPLQVGPQNNILPFGQRTKLGIEKGIEIGKYNEIDNTPYFEGRHIVGQNTPVNKGVYVPGSLGSNGDFNRECIVVDFGEDRALELFYTKLVDKLMLSTGKGLPDIVRIYDELLKPMINLRNSEKLIQNHSGKKIQLGLVLMEKAVVCRHNSLLFAAIFERLQQQGIVPPHFICSIQRHIDNWGGENEPLAPHAYCKIDTGNRYYIVDPVQRSSGWLENVAMNNPYAAEGDLSNPFTVGQSVNVLRTSGEVEIWLIKSITEDPNFPNNHRKDLITVQSQNGLVTKPVSYDDLRNWKNLTVTPKPPLSIPKIKLAA
jgi:hypothetical protein